MRKIIRTLLPGLCALAAVTAASGQSGTRQWSLQECIKYAVEHNIEIQKQILNIEGYEIDLNTARNSRLPSLSGSASQNFGFGWSENSQTHVYEANQSASTGFGLSSSAPIYSGLRIKHQVAYNELNVKAAVEGLEKAKEDLGLQVTHYYLDVLFKKELLTVARQRVALTDRQVERTGILVSEGKVPQSQLFDIRAQRAQHGVSLTNSENDLKLSLLTLTQVLNLPDAAGFDIRQPEDDSLLERNRVTGMSTDDIYDIAIGIKPHIREAEYRAEGSRQQIKIAQSSLYPSVNMSLGYNTSYGYIFNYDGSVNPFFDQLRHNRRQSIGIGVSVPIFNRLQTRNQIRSAKLTLATRMLDLDNVKLSLYKEIQQAYQNAMGAEAKYFAAQIALEAAQIAYNSVEYSYGVGKATAYEFNESQTNLIYSQSELIQAKYDYLFRAKILDFYRGEPILIR